MNEWKLDQAVRESEKSSHQKAFASEWFIFNFNFWSHAEIPQNTIMWETFSYCSIFFIYHLHTHKMALYISQDYSYQWWLTELDCYLWLVLQEKMSRWWWYRVVQDIKNKASQPWPFIPRKFMAWRLPFSKEYQIMFKVILFYFIVFIVWGREGKLPH